MTHSRRSGPDHLDRLLDAADLRLDAEDLALDRQQIKQLALFRRAVKADLNRMEKNIMADLSRLEAALGALGVDVTEVSAKIDDLKAQIAALSEGAVTQEQIDALAATAEGLDAAFDATTAPDSPEPAPEPEPAP